MLKHFKDTISDENITLKNFYEMAAPDSKYMKDRMKKVQTIIENMGNKYCLANQIKKITPKQKVLAK